MYRLYLFLLIWALPSAMHAQIDQYIIGNLGGEISSTDEAFSLVQSVGDPIAGFIAGSEISASQGFVQCFICDDCIKIVNVSDLPELSDLAVYPNPTTHGLTLEGNIYQVRYYQIVDMPGRSLGLHPLQGNRIDLQDLQPGLYVIQLLDEGKRLMATVKIVKQ